VLAATAPTQRPPDARLLVVDADGGLHHHARSELATQLRSGDLLVANDAATLPASLAGVHAASGAVIEVRLAGRRSLAVDDVRNFTAVVFGAGDYRTRTEDRAAPPALHRGDRLVLGPLSGVVARTLGHPRLVALRLDGKPDEVWAGIARHGKPIQYSHVDRPLALWDVWTSVAALPVAFEPPSASFVLDWKLLAALKASGVDFAALTHAAGISSTGDAALDARLPFDEPYNIPAATADAIMRTKMHGKRVIAIGTSVVRALEDAAANTPADGLRANASSRADGHERRLVWGGTRLATQRIGVHTKLRVVDAILTGTHEPGTSHYELLRAFAGNAVLRRARDELEETGYRTHEFGDSLLIFRGRERLPDSKDRAGVATKTARWERLGAEIHASALRMPSLVPPTRAIR
jgi:S-adenosylmethionine:tRNA ribosyltransferase-isomerase